MAAIEITVTTPLHPTDIQRNAASNGFLVLEIESPPGTTKEVCLEGMHYGPEEEGFRGTIEGRLYELDGRWSSDNKTSFPDIFYIFPV